MSGARERVLGDVRRALNREGPLPESFASVLEARLARPTANLEPALGDDLIARFVEKVESVNGKVTRAGSLDEVARIVSDHLAAHGLGDELVVAPDPALEGIPWSNRLAIERRPATGDDRVSVTGAYAGIAETGTVVLLSGPDSPTTLNFLPDDHVMVLREALIVAHMEDVWRRLREEQRPMPRTVNFITGPSKTADVEQTMQEGAHGPRRVHVILVPG